MGRRSKTHINFRIFPPVFSKNTFLFVSQQKEGMLLKISKIIVTRCYLEKEHELSLKTHSSIINLVVIVQSKDLYIFEPMIHLGEST